MAELFTALILFSAGGIVFYLWLDARRQNIARRRLEQAFAAAAEPEVDAIELRPARPFSRRYYTVPWIVAAAVSSLLWFVSGLRPLYSATVGLVVGMLGWQLEAMLAERRVQKIEIQLADAIDLMVGALRAGAGLTKALENAVYESRQPLREQLDEVAGRIHFGDDPQLAFRNLTERVPLETFLLFSSALSVHWEVGGSLAPTLATVGRTIRDRIELSRRMRAMSTQARVSIIAVMGITYFIAALMWGNDPVRMQGFLSTNIGSWFVAAVVLLQAVGIVWSASITRSKI
ncbi:MAG TPA: type II secretion system F family protein [Planctomycetaceae bacterium]|jgi:Flp pilus assembly protein TadB|nr:type II secretion system F family protein [Planctomycetaceae bacterium]